GANTAIFTVLDALLLKSLPVNDPEKVMFLSWSAKNFSDELISLQGRAKQTADGGVTSTAFSYPFFEQINSRTRAISGVAAFAGLPQEPIIVGGRTSTVTTQAVSGGYYAALGISPILGRRLEQEDDRPGARPVAMISYRLWQKQFGGD